VSARPATKTVYEPQDKKIGFTAGALQEIFEVCNPRHRVKVETGIHGQIKRLVIIHEEVPDVAIPSAD
jgi:hypothetical protein